jgi:hypothetical protein
MQWSVRIMAVRHYRLRRQRRLHLPCVKQNDSNPARFRPACSYCDNGPAFKSDLLHRNAKHAKEITKCPGLARALCFFHDLALRIRNSHGRLFQ